MEQTKNKRKDPNAYDAYLGEIQMVAFDFAPQGWAICDGKELKIREYEALFSLIGTKYGGNGTTNFALPDLRGRFPIAAGKGIGLEERKIAEKGGQEKVTLTEKEIPAHNHKLQGINGVPDSKFLKNRYLTNNPNNLYGERNSEEVISALNNESISMIGGGDSHDNMPPFLCINFIICLQGIYPPKQS